MILRRLLTTVGLLTVLLTVAACGTKRVTVTGANVSITPSGNVLADGVNLGRLQVVRIDDPAKLERIGAARFKPAPGQAQPAAVEPDVVPQSLEQSNVSAISSVVDLITASRGFQMYTKSAESIDQLNQVVINQIGRPR